MSTSIPKEGPGRQLKARLRAGEVLVGGMIAEYVRPSLVKCFQQAGCDFIYIEFEHGYFDLTALADTVQAARDNGLPVIAKTPQLERAAVAKLLECGVVGLQLPRTESRADIETLRSYLKFPPLGTPRRSAGIWQQRLLQSRRPPGVDGSSGRGNIPRGAYRNSTGVRAGRGNRLDAGGRYGLCRPG